VTEPTINPILAAPRHSRMPTCTRCSGCWATAPARDANSAAALTRMEKLRMKNLRQKRPQAGQSQRAGANGPDDKLGVFTILAILMFKCWARRKSAFAILQPARAGGAKIP